MTPVPILPVTGGDPNGSELFLDVGDALKINCAGAIVTVTSPMAQGAIGIGCFPVTLPTPTPTQSYRYENWID